MIYMIFNEYLSNNFIKDWKELWVTAIGPLLPHDPKLRLP